jgi:uncharacterized protein YndB with AHSA1/START domain
MLKKIGIGVAGLLASLVGLIAVQPSTYHVERSAVIDAKPETVFVLTGDLRQLDTWSAWAKSDPSQTMTFEGDSKAVGGKSMWKGEKTGEGVQTITERVENESLKIAMEFKVPMEATGTAAINLAAEGEGTKVTWEMDGENGFVGKGFSLVMDMDDMIGGKFDEGLAMLKVAAETAQTEAG